jgi:regulator of replication initiation timing
MSSETKHTKAFIEWFTKCHPKQCIGKSAYEITYEHAYAIEYAEFMNQRISSLEAQLAKANENLDFQSRIIEATDEVIERNVRLEAQNKELREALQEAGGVIRSINAGKGDRILVDGEPMYRQTEEWVRWAIDEILPVVDKALTGGG